MRWMPWLTGAVLLGAQGVPELIQARDRQDRAALEALIGRFAADSQRRPEAAAAHYRLALARSYLAEVALELRDRELARTAAEAGIAAARRAVELKPGEAEYHRVLGTLCGQVIPADVLRGMKYGRCAKESIARAIELAPRSSMALISRGIGNYYLPPMFGGGVDAAIADFRQAVELSPRSADAHLWLGIALRKANRPQEARKSLARAVELNPNRLWARQQLEKTPQ